MNHFAKKLDMIKTIIPGNVDVIIFGETKLDSSYPTSQFLMEDRNCNGGGILIYIREGIPSKLLNKVYEKIIHKQIAGYAEKFLSPFLCGYRKDFNPQYALLSLLER